MILAVKKTVLVMEIQGMNLWPVFSQSLYAEVAPGLDSHLMFWYANHLHQHEAIIHNNMLNSLFTFLILLFSLKRHIHSY